MKIKDTLDLCGWELWNFCIQNHQNLEGLLDLGAGRKVFYTGNDQGKNGREVIYDGSKWKVSAYMSDVDELRGLITALENATDEEIEALKGRATTTEGNLATLRSEFDALNKALNDDTAGVINTWEEVVDFVNEYNGSQDLSTILAGMNTKIDGKLNLSGGTITVENIGEFNVYNKKQNLSAVHFYATVNNVRTDIGYLGISAEKGPVYINRSGTQYTLLHEGNFVNFIGDTYLKTSGGTMNGRLGMKSYIRFNQYNEEVEYLLGMTSAGSPLQWYDGTKWDTILHSGNYSDLITTLNGSLSVGGAVNVGTGGLRVQGNLNAPIEINGSNIKRYGRGGGYLLSDDYYGLTPTKRLVQVGVFANDDELEFYCIGNRIESSSGGERWFTINSASSAFYVPTSFSSGITTNELTIGGIRLSVENGLLKIEGSAFATGELAAGGAATEGEGGAGGFSLYESWGTSAPTEPLALGANLGYELKTRVEDLELAKTKVTFEPALASGKPIGAIEIDGNKTNLFAPATYAWSEITGTENVLTTAGGTISGNIIMAEGNHVVTRELYAAKDATYDLGGNSRRWSNVHTVLINGGTPIHSGNYSNYALPLTGGRIKGTDANLLIVDCTDGSSYIRFDSKGQYLGRIGFTTDYKPIVHLIDNNTYEILTSAGGTIEGKDTVNGLLSINVTNHVGYGSLIFKVNGSSAASMGISSTNDVFLQNLAEGSNRKIFKISQTNLLYGSDILLHSGNVGEYNAGSATKLATPRTIWGQSFDGTGNVSGDITMNNYSAIKFKNAAGTSALNAMMVDSSNQLTIGYDQSANSLPTRIDGASVYLRYGTAHTNGLILNSSGNVLIGTTTDGGQKLQVDGVIKTTGGVRFKWGDYFDESGNFVFNQGSSWSIGDGTNNFLRINKATGNVLIGALTDNGSGAKLQVAGTTFSSRVLIGNGTDDGSTNLQVNGTSTFGGQSTFNALALFNKPIVAKDTLQIGDATLMWDGNKKALIVDKSLASMGEISAGGAGTEGGNTGGGGTGTITNPDVEYYNPKDNATHTFYHNLPYYDVVVQVYEKNAISGAWDMILADVTIANESNLVTVNFGRKENVEHKIVVR